MRERDSTVSALIAALQCCGFRGGTEAELQQVIARTLGDCGLAFTTEFAFNRTDRVDFFCDCGIAIECKVKGGSAGVARQLDRYAQHPSVDVIILVTTRYQHAAQIPEVIRETPVHLVVLSGLP